MAGGIDGLGRSQSSHGRNHSQGGDSGTQALTPARQSARGSDDATAALELASETAAAIRELEKQSAQAVARAHAVANALKEKLERAETRTERAEAALRQAEAEVEDLTAAIGRAEAGGGGKLNSLSLRRRSIRLDTLYARHSTRKPGEVDDVAKRSVDTRKSH